MAKWLIAALLLVHGLIHSLGAAKAFGLAELPQLTQAISRAWGIVWAACALCFAAAALARLANTPWWWMLGAPALLASQIVVVAFWGDAKFGTVANVLLILPVAIGFGGWRFAAHVDRDLAQLRHTSASAETVLVEAEALERLPPAVGRWLRNAGVVGTPRDRTIFLTQRGEMQKSPTDGWMPFRAKQWFRVPEPAFLWAVDVDADYGLSLTGRDRYIHGKGSMRIDLLSLVPVADASGSKIDQGSLVRFLAETMWFPSAALEPYIRWEAIDESSARATMSYAGVESAGVFRFDGEGNVVGFEAKRFREETLEDWIIENDPAGFELVDGVRIPTRSTITWRNDAGDSWTWLRLEVVSLKRNAELTQHP